MQKLYLLTKPLLVASLAIVISGCAHEKELTVMHMPKPPGECVKVQFQSVKKLPPGKTTDAQIAVWLAKEGTVRTKEQQVAKVCADYALRLYEKMRDRKPDGSG